MNRVVRGSSLVLMTAIVAACAAHRDENQGDQDKAAAQRQAPAPQPAAEEVDAKLAKAESEVRERALLEDLSVAATRRDQSAVQGTPVTVVSQESIVNVAASTAPAAKVAGNLAAVAPPYQQIQNTERYQHLDDNAVHLVADQPISTFSIDVDTGAYANVRRFLNAGQLPPQDAVRVEEMVNYFDYSYVPPASRDVPFRVATEVAPAPWNPQALLMKIGIMVF
jgi:Ca-activated chloride channel family protein